MSNIEQNWAKRLSAQGAQLVDCVAHKGNYKITFLCPCGNLETKYQSNLFAGQPALCKDCTSTFNKISREAKVFATLANAKLTILSIQTSVRDESGKVISPRSITFKCQCGSTCTRNFKDIKRTAPLCRDCLRKRSLL